MQTCANPVDDLIFKMLQNEYLVTKIGFDTAENEPSRVIFSLSKDATKASTCRHSLDSSLPAAQDRAAEREALREAQSVLSGAPRGAAKEANE